MYKQLPNILTTLRLLLAIPIAVLILRENYAGVLWVALLAGISDGADGWLARRWDAQTRYGAVVDPLSDKALLICTYVSLAIVGLIPDWIAQLVVARDMVIVLGAVSYHWLIGRYQMAPSFWGKACTLLQIIFALMILSHQVYPVLPPFAFQFTLWLVVGLTLISGANYVAVWGRAALKEKAS